MSRRARVETLGEAEQRWHKAIDAWRKEHGWYAVGAFGQRVVQRKGDALNEEGAVALFNDETPVFEVVLRPVTTAARKYMRTRKGTG